MAERTIDILLRLDADKKSSVQELSKELKKMTDQAVKLEAALKDAIGRGATDEAKQLEQELKFTKGYLKAIDDEARKLSLEKSLAASAQRAGQLKQKLESLGRIGNTLAIGSAAILTPLVMAVNKYKDSLGETEPTSKRLVDLSKRWEESQIRLGRVVAEQILPHLEKALDYVDKAVKFAEDNPGFIEAAVTVVGAIGILGTILSGIAQVGQALVAFQTLTAGLGLGTAATGTGTAAVAGTAAVGGEAAIAAGVTTAIGSAVFLAAVTVAAAEGTRQIFNAITGQNQTWADIGTTLAQILVFAAEGWDLLFGFFGMETNFSTALSNLFNISDLNLSKAITVSATSVITNIGKSIQAAAVGVWTNITNSVTSMAQRLWDGLVNLGSTIVQGFLAAIIPGKATGGELSSPGVFMGAEKGREFVMSNATTKAAENIIGGKLTQARLLQALAGGRNVSYHDSRRFDASVSANDRRMIRNDTMMTLSEALG